MNTPHTTAIREAAEAVVALTQHTLDMPASDVLAAAVDIISRRISPLLEQAEKWPLMETIYRLEKERDQVLARAAAAEGKLSLAHTLYANFLRSVLPEHTMKDFKEHEAVLWDAARHEMWRCKSIEGDKNRAETALAEALAKLAACEAVIEKIAAVTCVQSDYARAEECQRIAQAHLSQSKGSDHG